MFKYLVAAFLIVAVSCEETENSKACKETWAPYHTADPTETGVRLFYHFFELHPEIQAEFPKFKDVDLAHLKENAEFRAHATKIFHVIDDAVMKHNWEDVDTLSQFHHDIGKTDKAPYEAFRTMFYDLVTKHASDHVGAWEKCMAKFFHHFYSHF